MLWLSYFGFTYCFCLPISPCFPPFFSLIWFECPHFYGINKKRILFHLSSFSIIFFRRYIHWYFSYCCFVLFHFFILNFLSCFFFLSNFSHLLSSIFNFQWSFQSLFYIFLSYIIFCFVVVLAYFTIFIFISITSS